MKSYKPLQIWGEGIEFLINESKCAYKHQSFVTLRELNESS